MILPNASQAFVDLRKLSDYALSSENDRGQHKAKVFASALGLGVADAEWLRQRLLDGVRTNLGVRKGATLYGILYEVDIPVQTKTASATVRTGWIVRSNEAFPRLTSCYVL